MKPQSSPRDETQAVIASFLETHYAQVHSNDVGPSLGLLSLLRYEPPARTAAQQQWIDAVSAALTGQLPTHTH